MYVAIWEFLVQPNRCEEFEAVYGSSGQWARLFAQAAGFLGTELLCDTSRPTRYVTLDRWQSRQAYEKFRSQFDAEYRQLDAQCEDLTAEETLIGRFEM